MKPSSRLLIMSALAAVVAAPAVAREAGDWVLRAGVGTIQPKHAGLSLGTIYPPGGVTAEPAEIEFDSATSLMLSGSYMFTPNWALDILAPWPFRHDIDIEATFSDGVATQGGKLPFGEVELFPPTVSLQYYFTPNGEFHPYVGLGISYTRFIDEKLESEITADGITALEFDDSVGIAVQLGAESMFGAGNHWLLNFDLRWIEIEADTSLSVDDGTVPATNEIGTVDIDPWALTVDLGYRF